MPKCYSKNEEKNNDEQAKKISKEDCLKQINAACLKEKYDDLLIQVKTRLLREDYKNERYYDYRIYHIDYYYLKGVYHRLTSDERCIFDDLVCNFAKQEALRLICMEDVNIIKNLTRKYKLHLSKGIIGNYKEKSEFLSPILDRLSDIDETLFDFNERFTDLIRLLKFLLSESKFVSTISADRNPINRLFSKIDIQSQSKGSEYIKAIKKIIDYYPSIIPTDREIIEWNFNNRFK